MKKRTLFATVLSLIMAFSVAVPLARADEANQKTEITFSAPVRIPGQTLPAGTYWFQLTNTDNNLNLVQIYNGTFSHVYASLLTAPVLRGQSRSHTTLTFAEQPKNRPEALLAWYYPGDLTGHQFLYRKPVEKMLARDVHQQIVAAPGEPVAMNG
ncbi:MAG: hypothetical protein WBW53_06460 [Terriglobales bacterium]